MAVTVGANGRCSRQCHQHRRVRGRGCGAHRRMDQRHARPNGLVQCAGTFCRCSANSPRCATKASAPSSTSYFYGYCLPIFGGAAGNRTRKDIVSGQRCLRPIGEPDLYGPLKVVKVLSDRYRVTFHAQRELAPLLSADPPHATPACGTARSACAPPGGEHRRDDRCDERCHRCGPTAFDGR